MRDPSGGKFTGFRPPRLRLLVLRGLMAGAVFGTLCGSLLVIPSMSGNRPPTVSELFARDERANEALGPAAILRRTWIENGNDRKELAYYRSRQNDYLHRIDTFTHNGRTYKFWLNGNESVLLDTAANVYHLKEIASFLERMRRFNRKKQAKWLEGEGTQADLARAKVDPFTYKGQPTWKATWEDSDETDPDNAYEFVLMADRQNGLIYRFEQKTRRGPVIVIEHTYEPCKPLPAGDFRFVPPKGSRKGVLTLGDTIFQ